MNAIHERIEVLAGAIALGEATDEERAEYREHIAACRVCCEQFGGEREIERVASTVEAARESEVWRPDLGDVVEVRRKRRARAVRAGLGIAGFSVALSLGAHALLTAGVAHLAPSSGAPVVIDAGATRIVVEQSSLATPRPAVPAPQQRRLIVEHNVVQIARQTVPIPAQAAAPLKADAKPQQIAAITVHAQPTVPPAPVLHAAKSDIPVWRRADDSTWRTVATTTTTSLSETAPQSLTHHAESMQLASPHTMRDAAPVGGATAINPQPPMIAYDEGAEGTSAFEVLIDDRGNPTKCIITKSAGYAVLDSTVCKAAMQARYTPKLIDGRAVAGVYRDAFTFRVSEDDQNIEGVPKQIP